MNERSWILEGSHEGKITDHVRIRNGNEEGSGSGASPSCKGIRDTETGGDLMNGGGLVLILVSQQDHLISIPITPPLMPLHTSCPPSSAPDQGGIRWRLMIHSPANS